MSWRLNRLPRPAGSQAIDRVALGMARPFQATQHCAANALGVQRGRWLAQVFHPVAWKYLLSNGL
jgi:hypothetical protein